MGLWTKYAGMGRVGGKLFTRMQGWDGVGNEICGYGGLVTPHNPMQAP